MENEIWKDVVGYEGYYQVSNLGRIRSCDREVRFGKQKRISKGRILSQNKAGSNYNHIKLSAKNVVKRHYIHRLIASAFLEKSENTFEVDHIDGDTRNNNVENLRWCTKLENISNSNTIDKNLNTRFKKGNLPKNKIDFEEKLKKPIQEYIFKKICIENNITPETYTKIWKGDYRKDKKEKLYYYFKKENYE
ncbi:HNH endonuclease [Cetobacterium somerae]|uniref:NUMOD4 motif-containing HNH endonuclease n=1 Tax=Cetobacterium somerae TaxID=188913 RepID=UPI00211EAAC5|nr:NUMOD4 motif-containing HNH endonuclease [Cetobacterium somerae]MCQ9627538.1 HNH endonuclease [Cetobacterium somerae]